MKSKAMQILVPGGNPNGMKIIEVPGWSGKCFLLPRQNLKELKDFPDIDKPGLYVLFGFDEESGDDLAYIGESENFYNRITNHDSNKDFWDTAAIFTGVLNKAHVKYLEHKATVLAHKVNRMMIQNKVQPPENSLSDIDKISVEDFFEKVQFVLETLGYQLFSAITESISDKKIYEFSDATNKAGNGKGSLLESGEFIVYKGSFSRIKETPSFAGYSGSLLRKKLENDGVIKRFNEESFIFENDYVFKSPSAAADCIAGRSCNGWTAWKDDKGKTLDENVRK